MRSQIRQWIADAKGAALGYLAGLSFLASVALGLLFQPPVFVPFVLLFLGFVALGVSRIRFRAPCIAVSVVCAAFALGLVRTMLLPDLEAPFSRFDGAQVILEAKVVRDPEVRVSGVRAVARTVSIDSWKVEGTILLQLPIGSAVSYGDTVSVRGKLALPRAFMTDQGKAFDYESYLHAKGVGATLQAQNVQVTKPHSFSVTGSLYALKHSFMRLVERTLPEPSSGLLEGMLLGYRDALSQKLNDAFVTSGLVHIVVLSGYNLSLVANVLLITSALILPRTLALIAAAVSVALFAAMAGLDATVVRAAIMALIVIFGKWLRRPSVIMRSLTVACIAMVAWNPHALLFDPSFVLSFLATFGLVTLSPAMERLLYFIPKRVSFLQEIAAATLATQAFVFPVLIFYTGRFSLIALPANLLALPVVPYAMLAGFIASMAGLLGDVIAFPFATIAWVLLSAVIWVAQIAAAVPFASVDVSFLSTPLLLALYLILAPVALILWKRFEPEKKKSLA
jgi:competence protein ComEC